MTDILIYIELGLSFLLIVLSSLIYRKWRIWKLVLFPIIIAPYAIALVMPSWIPVLTIDQFKFYYEIFALLGTAAFAVGFRSKIRITRNLTDYDFFELEKELDEVKNASELLRLRYISTIGLLTEALAFHDVANNTLFVTDQFKKIVELDKSDFTIDEYCATIHQDDRGQYLAALRKASKKAPTYDVKYRVMRAGGAVWVEERGRAFEFDGTIHVVAAVRAIDMKLFPETMIHELDSIPTEQQLVQYLTQILKEPETFYLVMIQLTNIPDVNARFGRDVGNLMIAEYIKKMRYHFAKDVNSIFRITGIQFALVISEQRKYEVLLRALQSGGDLVNLMINIGGIQQVVYPNLGVIKHEPW
ncbi:MAG: PAS domain-containing protein, partial [Bacillota bacterium]|nr:PAS domain-containing protein [Bacillota bacterium]